jgi:predicted amidohydrolase YtcJ
VSAALRAVLAACLLGVAPAIFAAAAGSASSPGDSTSPRDAPADLVLLHGKIHTEDPGRTVAQALALRGNTIVAVGTDQAVSALIGPKTRTVDLGGRVVLPGIIDAHTHPAESALDLGKCSLGDELLAPADIKIKVAKCLKEEPADHPPWFEVTQVNASKLTLTRRDLDSMSAKRPLLLGSADGHTAWANTAALNAAHIGAGTKDPTGGRIERDPGGNPTGTLRDVAAEIVYAAKPAPSFDFQVSQLDKALTEMRATGITSVQDADTNDDEMRQYKKLYDEHRLNMRVRASFGLKQTDRTAETLIGEAVEFRTRWAVDPDYLRADAIKIFADGVIEYPSQTAALLEPYLDDNRGPTYYSQEHLNRIVDAANAAGFTVHVHAIGDRAIRSALDAFADSRRHNGIRDDRNQIAHLELINPQDFARFKELGVIANFQLLWAERDPYVVAATLPYLGPERSRYIYPARSLLDAGALIAGGSDWGVSSFNAFAAMEHAITRCEARGHEPLLPEQSIPLQTVVDAYAINAAFALKQERTTGSLERGKRADFIVLDRDIFAIDPFDLHATQVLETYLDGRKVYSAKPSLQ